MRIRGRREVDTAQDTYRALVKSQLAPGLRALGFKGSGRSYELPSTTHWAMLGLQASAWSDRKEVRFTVNLLVVPRDVWAAESASHPYLGAKASPNTHPGLFAWWARLGSLMPAGEDTWWRVAAGKSTERLAREVLQAIELYGLPALRARAS
jgi:Domain of unknown function (DUF4304)